ncbi:MAG: rRNA maturation RNase YbeY [Crocinitomicaceae bacterium]|nr:rRNA maturation RNase YbeY [Crocinitomicaceae bacterium]
MVNIFFEDTDALDLSPKLFVSWLSDLVSRETLELGEVSLIFTSDEYLLSVNQEHLNHDFYTDIITFDYRSGGVVSADLFISIDMVRYNADKLSLVFLNELYRVVAHGVLHVCGYGDKTPDEKILMTQKENEALVLIRSYL